MRCVAGRPRRCWPWHRLSQRSPSLRRPRPTPQQAPQADLRVSEWRGAGCVTDARLAVLVRSGQPPPGGQHDNKPGERRQRRRHSHRHQHGQDYRGEADSLRRHTLHERSGGVQPEAGPQRHSPRQHCRPGPHSQSGNEVSGGADNRRPDRPSECDQCDGGPSAPAAGAGDREAVPGAADPPRQRTSHRRRRPSPPAAAVTRRRGSPLDPQLVQQERPRPHTPRFRFAEPDDHMDVRSNSPRGGRAPQVDLHQEAATPAAADDEAQGQAHPAWHLVNARRCGLSKNPFSDRIVGGATAALGQYPWLVRMGYNLDDVPRRVYRCAGAVITHLHVLTAAHCVKNLPQNFEFAGVRLGEWDTTTDPDCQTSVCAPAVYDVDPESVIVHQDYNNPRFANDIALVKLAQKLSFNGWVAPVCIPYGDLLTKSFESERTEVAGWGIYDINLQKSSQELRMVHLPVVSNSICHALYRNQANITKKQMCAGGELGSDACSGDSGGPLLRVEAYSGGPRYYIVGIVSFGSRRCGLTPAPGVYTRVSYYIDWILDNIEQT